MHKPHSVAKKKKKTQRESEKGPLGDDNFKEILPQLGKYCWKATASKHITISAAKCMNSYAILLITSPHWKRVVLPQMREGFVDFRMAGKGCIPLPGENRRLRENKRLARVGACVCRPRFGWHQRDLINSWAARALCLHPCHPASKGYSDYIGDVHCRIIYKAKRLEVSTCVSQNQSGPD